MSRSQIIPMWIGIMLGIAALILPPREGYGGAFVGWSPAWSPIHYAIHIPYLLIELGLIAVIVFAVSKSIGPISRP